MGGSNGGQAYSLAGGLSFGVAYVLDGATHNNPYDNLNLPLPFPDALQEFRAETSALTAQNGMHSGAAVNAVTKSGTNQFRGDGFEFFRHHSLNATDPFAAKNADGTRKDDGLKRNQYGATLGGPIKTDKLFFFGGYQGTNYGDQPDRQPRVRADGGDAGRRLHGLRVRRRATAACRRTWARRLSATGQPGAVQQGGAEYHRRSCPRPTDPVRPRAVSVCRPRPTKGSTSARSTTRSTASTRCSAGTSRRKQFTPPPYSLAAARAEPAGDAHRRPRQPGPDASRSARTS